MKQASRQLLRTGLAVAAPFLLVVGCVSGRELLARRIYGPDDVRGALGVRVLGAVPRPRPAGGRPAGRAATGRTR